MDSATLFRVILFWHVLSLVYSVVPLAKKTKLCGNEACSEKLFDGKFHRSMGANDERFLAPKVDDSVSIYAIKFSDRTDLMEGALTREPERRGSFFSSYITLDGYVDFLRSAVESNKTLFMISTDPHDHPAKKLVGLKSAYPELIRDYEVNSQRLVDEGIIPQAVPLNLTALDPKVVEALSHDHSHSGHGHSHGGIGYEDVHSHNPPPVAIQPPPTKGPVAELSSDPASASLPSQQSPPVQQQPSLTQQQPPPVQQQPLPVQQQPLGVQQQPPPVQQQPSPVQQQSPPVQQQSPPVQQQPPPVQQQPSPVQQQSPSVQQQPPPTQQQPPPVQQQSSPVQQQSPPLQQQPSSVQQHPPPTQQQPPPVQQQPPPVQQQPPPVQQQPPLVQQQSPPSKQQPSPHHQQSSPVQEQSPTQHQSSPTVERPSSYSQQSNSAETLAGGRPPVAAANSATISSSEHVNEHGFAEQNVLIDEENVFDRFTHEGMKKEVAAGVDVTPPGNNDAVQQTVPGSTQQRIPRDAESVADSVKSQPNLNASQLRQHQNVLVLNAGGGIEQHSPQLQIVRTVAVPVSGVPANTQQPASSVTSHQAVVRPASVPISEIPIVDPSVVIHRAFVEQKNTGASSTRKVQDEGLLGSSQHPIGVGAGVPVGSGVNMNGETTNPIVDGANTVSVHSSDPPPILNVADMQNRYFVADNQLPVEIGVKEPSGSSITVNVADSDTIPDDTNTVPVASSNPSASFNAKSLQNGEPAADEQLPFEGGAQISFGSGMTVDAAAINSSVSKTTVIPAAPTINPPTHTSGGLSEPQTVPPGDQFRADNVISRGGGGNALLGSKFAEALPAQSLGRSQGQMFAGSPPLGSQQFPTNTESNENTRVRQFSAQQSVITQEPQPASDGDFSAHATNVPLEQFSSTQSPIVPSFSSIPVNDVHAGTVPVESPPAKFISVTTDFSEQQSGVNLDTQTPLSIPVKSADGRTLNEALVEAQIPPTLQAHSLLAARASGGIPHEPLISNVDIPTTTEPPFTLPVDVASAHGSAPSTAVTPPKPLPPTAEQFPSTFSASDGISDGLDDRVSQPINSFVPSPPSEGQMRSDIFQNPSNATANTNAEGLDTSIKNGESANDTMQHLTDSIEMPISNGTNASETKNTKPEWESADNVHTISGKQMKDSGSSEEMTNTTSRDENMHQVVTKTDVKVPESETTTGLQDSVKETTRRSTSDLKTEIIEEDGLGYCIKGDCDKVYTEQPTTEQTQSSATPETSQSQSVAQSVPPLPSSQERSTETVNEQQQPDHFHETRVFQQSIDRDHQAGPAEPSQVAANHQATGQQQPAAFGNQPSQVNAIDPQKPVSEESSGVGKWLSKVISLFRYALPPPLAGIDDAGVVVTLMVPICLITHVLRTLFLSDNSEQDAFDRRALHDALTAVRERDEQIKILRVEAEKVHGIASRGKDEKIEQLELDLGQGKLEIQQLRNRCGHLEETNKRLKKEADEARKLAENERCEVNALCDEKKQFERSAQMLSDQIAEMQSTMENAREKNEKLEDELADKNALIARLETEARISAVEVKKLTAQLQTSVEEGAMLRDRVDALQNETVQLSEMIDELSKAREVTTSTDSAPHADDHGAHESGGSAGWSDIGDFDIETSPSEEKKQATTGNQSRKEKEGSPSKAHPADIMEVARLRAQLKRLETDLDQAKLALQKEENLHEHLTRKIELAELEATERKKEAEAKEAERVDTHNQCKKMLIMVEERDAKIRRSEEVTERLRDEVNKWQTEVRHLEEQNRRIQNKLNEAEQELKRLRAENNRLETRHFHELRECKQTIGALQQSLEASQLAAISKSPDGGNLLNLSSNGSSDREFGAPFVSHLGPPPLPTIRPLWGDDEPVEIFSAGESSVLSGGGLRGTTLPDDLSGVAVKKGARSRRSHREPRDTSPDLGGQYAARPKKEGRRRSRSHGRHPYSSGGSYMPQMGGMPPAFPDLFNGPPLSKRNSKSGNLYYSSGGSNGGLSPPPEMALLSGVPPPGMTIKKPTATSRPKSVTEQMSRLQN